MDADPADLLEPIELGPQLRKLDLTLGQVCRVAGVSRAQLDYWTARAQIPTKGRKQRLYPMESLELVMLIRQGKEKGLSLQAAIEAARSFSFRRRGAGRPLELGS
ncbi:MAG: MerR family transcriptional regulator [Gaiellaceae bacterium]